MATSDVSQGLGPALPPSCASCLKVLPGTKITAQLILHVVAGTGFFRDPCRPRLIGEGSCSAAVPVAAWLRRRVRGNCCLCAEPDVGSLRAGKVHRNIVVALGRLRNPRATSVDNRAGNSGSAAGAEASQRRTSFRQFGRKLQALGLELLLEVSAAWAYWRHRRSCARRQFGELSRSANKGVLGALATIAKLVPPSY